MGNHTKNRLVSLRPDAPQREKCRKKELLTRLAAGLAAALVLLGLFFYARGGALSEGAARFEDYSIEKARVLEITDKKLVDDPNFKGLRGGTETLELELLTGPYAGDWVTVPNPVTVYYNGNVLPDPGDTVTVRVRTNGDNEYTVAVYNYDRGPWLWIFAGVFLLALVLVGGRQGLAAVFGLVFTMAAVVFVLMPLIARRHWDPVAATLLTVALTCFASYVFIGGLHTKAMTAAGGAFAGVLLAGLFAWAAGKLVHINGMSMDEAENLYYTFAGTGADVRKLLLCGVLISAEGAIMDISMSVASTVEEVHRVSPALTAKQLFKSGMHVGRDAMGTMSNTLILAFAGTAMNMMLIVAATDIPYREIINSEWITIAAVRALAGSLGMVLTVPVVALLAANVFAREKTEKESLENG